MTAPLPDMPPYASSSQRIPGIIPRVFHHADFSLNTLLEQKAQQGLRIALAIPTLNEAATIGAIVRTAQSALQQEHALLDEILVIDSGSEDGTCALAAEAGAQVTLARDILPEIVSPGGKGENLWKAAHVSSADILCFIDGDIANFAPHFVTGLLGPLLLEETLLFTKAFYERPLSPGGRLPDPGGGRVTEILVRPFFSLFFPHLCGIIQPLSGEYAMRRELLENLVFPSGYGVEAAHLIDIARIYGLGVMAQVDLEERVHRVRATADLGRMAFGILQSLWQRLPEQDAAAQAIASPPPFQSMLWDGQQYHLTRSELKETDLPPHSSLGTP